MTDTTYIRVDGERVAVEASLLAWRRRVLNTCLKVVVLGAGVTIWVPSMIIEYGTAQWGMLATDLLLFPPLIWLAIKQASLPFGFVAHGLVWGLIALGVGYALQGELATHLPILMGAAVGATILFDLAQARRFVMLIAGLVVVFGCLVAVDVLPHAKSDHTPWGVAFMVLMFLLANGVTLGVAVVIAGLRAAVNEATVARAEQTRADDARARLEAVVEQTDDPLLVLDVAGVIVYANPAFRRLTGDVDPAGARLADTALGFSREEVGDMLTAAIDAPWSGQVEVQLAEPHVLALSCSAIRNLGVVVRFVLALRDVTDLRSLELQLQQAKKLEAIGTLAGGIAHDLNNLLVPVLTYTELAMTALERGSPPERVREDLTQILHTGLQARALVQKILRFTRKSSTEPEPVLVCELAGEVAKLVRPSLPGGVSLELDLQDPQASVMADPSDLHQVFVNLCTNAVHAMRETSGSLRVRVAEAEGAVEIEVEDEGCGIPADVLERVFDPFFTTKGPGEGTGLGLATVHGIVQRLGGRVELESVPGQGTSVRLTLPACAVRPAPFIGRPSLRRFAGQALLVDDEIVVLKATTRMLTQLGFAVTAAQNPREALAILLADPHRFAVMVTDVCMPEMDGVALAEHVRGVAPEMPVVVMTGNAETARLDRVAGVERCVVVHKPITRRELVRTIDRVVRERSEVREAG